MNRIIIDFVPHQQQRYNTPGDYFYDKNFDNGELLKVVISKLDDPYLEELVAIHEMIEEMLTRKFGITEQQIMDFDLKYEKEREQGLHEPEDEPGFDKDSPYWKWHQVSTSIEMLLCALLDVNWEQYNGLFAKLKWIREKTNEIKLGDGHILHRIENERQENIS